MELLKQFNVTGQSHTIVYESRYQPQSIIVGDINKMGIYIVCDKITQKLWLIEIIQNYTPDDGYTYVLKTVEDISNGSLSDIRDRYDTIVSIELYQESHWICGNIRSVLKSPFMLQHERKLKIKKLLQKKRRV